MKKRVVVIGSAGFVGSAIVTMLGSAIYEVIGLSRHDCDLTSPTSRAILRSIVRDGDIVVCAAAKAPAKNMEMLNENISLITNIAEALRGKRLAYVLNIGSDAIYGDSAEPLTETSVIEPLSAHGIMHAMREYILSERVDAPMGSLRPTLIYGAGDPHNGYGPNSFIRLAQAGDTLALFGNGEEQRDHVFVGDVATIALAMIAAKTQGAVNAVSGRTLSFMEIATLVSSAAKTPIKIINKPRSGPMPHNGFRAFTNDVARALCPTLQFKTMEEYVAERMA